MAVSPTGTSTDPTSGSTPSATAPSIGSATKGLGEDAFLQLLTTQLENQNPLQPQDPTQFVAELAQFSSLDMLSQINTSVQALGTRLGASSTTAPATQTTQTNQNTSPTTGSNS